MLKGMETTVQADALPERERRVVLERVRGPLKGLMQICGCESRLQEKGGGMPTFLPQVNDPRGEGLVGPASLIAAKRLYWFYREIFTPEETKRYDVRQR